MIEDSHIYNNEPGVVAPALRAFFALAEAWELSEVEQMKVLGISSRSTLENLKAARSRNVTRDTLERISCILGIFKAVGTLLPDPERADAWMRAPNAAPLFEGRSALDRMTAGDVGDLHAVRRYLDSQVG